MASPPAETKTAPVRLVCPVCKGGLAGKAGLSCSPCGVSFPSIDGIPALIAGRPGREDRIKRQIAGYYDREAENYEKSHGIGMPGGSWSIRNKYLPFFKRHLRGHELLLEIGAGTGALTGHLRRLAREIVPADISPGMLCRGRALGRFGFAVAADAEALPFPDRSFDAVAAVNALSYCPGKDRALLEVRRVLKPGGCFLLIDMNYLLHLPYHIVALTEFRKSVLWLGPLLESTPWGWRRRTEKAGLDLVEEFQFNWIPHRLPEAAVRFFAGLDSLLSRIPLVNRLAMRLALAARRPVEGT